MGGLAEEPSGTRGPFFHPQRPRDTGVVQREGSSSSASSFQRGSEGGVGREAILRGLWRPGAFLHACLYPTWIYDLGDCSCGSPHPVSPVHPQSWVSCHGC